MPTNGLLLLLRGLPGSGKSTLATELVKQPAFSSAKLLDPDLVDVDSKEFKKFLQTQPKDLLFKTVLYRFLLDHACHALVSGEKVIWAQPWRNLDFLKLTLGKINENGYQLQRTDKYPFEVAIVQITISVDTARNRIEVRNKIGAHALTVKDFREFELSPQDPSRLGLPVITLDGTTPSREQVNTVLDFLRKPR